MNIQELYEAKINNIRSIHVARSWMFLGYLYDIGSYYKYSETRNLSGGKYGSFGFLHRIRRGE